MLRPKSPKRGEMIEFLVQMPTDAMIFSHDGSSGFGGNADSAETADLIAC
jgi:hypothetical protein